MKHTPEHIHFAMDLNKTNTYLNTHARTHARTHAHAHKHTNTHPENNVTLFLITKKTKVLNQLNPP